MKFAYFGSSHFSKAVLEGLYAEGLIPEIIISRADKPKGRGLKVTPTQVSLFAQSKKIALIKPLALDNKVKGKLLQAGLDFFIVADYGRIIPLDLLSVPKIFSICVHPSLLPLYRGSTPIEQALINGDKETGVTIFKMNERVDAGEIILQKKIAVDYRDDYYSLGRKLIKEGVLILAQALKSIEKGSHTLISQDESSATYASKLKKQDARISWDCSASRIRNLIRALIGRPQAFTRYKDLMIKVLEADVIDEGPAAKAGTVVAVDKEGISVAASKSILKIKKVKPQGKKEISAWEFVCGYRVKAGDRFI